MHIYVYVYLIYNTLQADNNSHIKIDSRTSDIMSAAYITQARSEELPGEYDRGEYRERAVR